MQCWHRVNDMAKRPSRYSGRGGLARDASKKLKFLVRETAAGPLGDIIDKLFLTRGRRNWMKHADARCKQA